MTLNDHNGVVMTATSDMLTKMTEVRNMLRQKAPEVLSMPSDNPAKTAFMAEIENRTYLENLVEVLCEILNGMLQDMTLRSPRASAQTMMIAVSMVHDAGLLEPEVKS